MNARSRDGRRALRLGLLLAASALCGASCTWLENEFSTLDRVAPALRREAMAVPAGVTARP